LAFHHSKQLVGVLKIINECTCDLIASRSFVVNRGINNPPLLPYSLLTSNTEDGLAVSSFQTIFT